MNDTQHGTGANSPIAHSYNTHDPPLRIGGTAGVAGWGRGVADGCRWGGAASQLCIAGGGGGGGKGWVFLPGLGATIKRVVSPHIYIYTHKSDHETLFREVGWTVGWGGGWGWVSEEGVGANRTSRWWLLCVFFSLCTFCLWWLLQITGAPRQLRPVWVCGLHIDTKSLSGSATKERRGIGGTKKMYVPESLAEVSKPVCRITPRPQPPPRPAGRASPS